MKKRNMTLLAAIAAAAAFASTAQAAVVLPSDAYVTGGGAYRILFITTAKTAATSANIGDYNTIAQTAGNTVLAGQTWKVVGGTATIGARTNTGALAVGDTGYALGVNDVPIYTTNGLRVTNNNAALWAGSMLSRLKNQTGGDYDFNGTVHVGFIAGGDIRASGANYGPLGNTGAFTVGDAISSRTGTSNMYGNHNTATSFETPLYALSGVINPVPEPSSLSLLALGGLALLRRRRA